MKKYYSTKLKEDNITITDDLLKEEVIIRDSYLNRIIIDSYLKGTLKFNTKDKELKLSGAGMQLIISPERINIEKEWWLDKPLLDLEVVNIMELYEKCRSIKSFDDLKGFGMKGDEEAWFLKG